MTLRLRRTAKRDGLPVYNGPGVYAITNKRNGKPYVGSAFSIRGRLHNHRGRLRKGIHENPLLQHAWDKYGEKAFRFDIVQTCRTDLVLVREQYWMDETKSYDRRYGYNICPVAGNVMGGRKHSEASRRKMSRSQKGRDMTKVTAAAAVANRGRKRPAEVCARIGAAHKGRKHTKAARANMTAAHWSKGPNAAEVAARLAKSKTGVPMAEETKAKISATSLGRPKSAETRRRMRESWRRRHSV